MWARLLKALHELGAIGMMGALAAHLVLVATAPTDSLVGYLAVRHGIDAISRWLLLPSLVLVAISGLLSIAATRAFMDAGWAWIKALLGLVMAEGTLVSINGSARRVTELAQQALASGTPDAEALAPILRTEWNGLWLLLLLSLANIVLAVWRPRLHRRPRVEPQIAKPGSDAKD